MRSSAPTRIVSTASRRARGRSVRFSRAARAAAAAAAVVRRLRRLAPRQAGRHRRQRAAAAGQAGAAVAAPVAQRSPSNGGWTTEQMKAKYGEITMLDFPQFTKDTFPGVTHMDLFSGLFGDVTDDSMFAGRTFDPMTPSGRKWLDRMAATMAKTGVKCQHISNNAPTNLAGPDEDAAQGRRRHREAVARGLRRARREVDAHELDSGARSRNPPQRHSARARRRLSAQRRHHPAAQGARSSRTRRWPTSAATWGSRSRSRTTGGSPRIRRTSASSSTRSTIRTARRRRTSATGNTSTCCSTA